LTSRQGVFRRLEERQRIYFEVKRLASSGLSYPEIGRRLGIHRDLVRMYNLRTTAPWVERYNPDLSPSPALAYLIGFWLGDGRDAVGEKKVRFQLADKQQLDYVNIVTAKLLDREPKPIRMEGQFYAVDYDTALMYDYLAQPLEELLPCIKAYPSQFLRGFFDAEGYITFHPATGASLVIELGVANTNLDYLDLVQNLLDSLGMTVRRRVTNKKGGIMTIRGRSFVRKHDVWHLCIRRLEDIPRFSRKVGFANARKAGKLRDAVGMLRLSPHDRCAWFLDHYAKRGRFWVRNAERS